jgi:trimeric autotransporter adhesin
MFVDVNKIASILDPLLGWRPDVLATAPDGGRKTKKKIRKVMSNNISRKGLAWGALVAIAASLFATAPAHAAAGVTLNANTTSQVLSVPNGTSYTLVETASSEIPTSSYGTLAFSVVNNNAGAGVVTVGGRTTQSFATTDARVTFTAAQVAAASNNITIEVRSTSSATASYTVTSWLDANNNGVVDNGEYSASQTITFKSAADLSAATTTSFVSTPTYTTDARSLSVRVAFDSTLINNDQLAGSTQQTRISNNVSVDVRVGTYDARLVPATNAAAVVGSGDARFYANTGTNVNPTNSVDISDGARVWYSGAIFTAQAYWGTTAIGAKASTANGLINNQATSVSANVVSGANAILKDVNNSASVRLNSAFQVSATIRGDAGVLVGQAVKFGVTTAAWTTGTIRVTVNGTTYANSADLRAATWSVNSDANGNALLNVSVAGATVDALNDIVFTATSAALPVASVRVSQTKAVATTLAATPASQAVVLGSAATLASTIKDQFGQLIADTNYAIKVTYADGAGSSASGAFNAVANGAATSSVTVDGTVTGTTHYNVNAVTVAADGSQTPSGLTQVVVTVVTRAAADLVVGYVVNVATVGARESVDTKALAGAAGDATVAVSVTGRAVITGDRGVPYAKITIAGAGLFVLDTTASTYAAAPFVVTADANGYFTATIRSNTSGTIAGTVASGSATAVAFNVVVDAPGQYAGVSVATASPSYVVLVGNDGLVTFSARDTFGNLLTAASLTARGDDGSYYTVLDAKGNLNISANARTTAGSTTYTYTYSNDTRLYTGTVRVDWAKANVTVTLPDTITAGQNADVVVTVTDPAGNALSGKSVSATSTGVGYLTVSSGTTDSNGQATLKLYANENELGWAYITATSTPAGNVASTSDATGVQVVAPDVVPTATDSVASIALDVPATAQAGTVVDVVATATDADGNPVTGAVVAATSTGVGYLAINGGTTDANGQVVLKLVISGGENGTASVVATAGTAQSDAAQVTAGVTDANITLNKKRVTVDWSFAANKKVVIVRDGVAIKSFTASSNAADSFSFNLKTGTHKVSVKVGGVTLDSQSYKIAK